MSKNSNSVPIIDGIYEYDANPFTQIWIPPTHSTYVDNKLESQCIISSKPLDEIRKKLGIEYKNDSSKSQNCLIKSKGKRHR